MAWYEDWFDSDLYEVVYRSRNLADAQRLADLIVRVADPSPEAPILDVGTGRGRHARVLARRGYHVTGLDLSENAIETARRRAEREGLSDRTAFVTGDMRLPHFQARFGGVVNLFSTFGYFSDEADHGRAIQAMAAALTPGGWLVQDLLNPPYVRARLVPRDNQTVSVPKASGETSAIRVVQERRIVEPEPGRPRVEKTITMTPLAPHGTAGDTPEGEPVVFTESVRLLTPDALAPLYAAAGLETVALYGDYDGAPYSDASPRLIVHAVARGH